MTKEELSKLTPEQKRIAIAEACGWIKVKENERGYIFGQRPNETRKWPVASILTLQEPVTARSLVPDYLNDLSAMNEAEKVLKNGQRFGFYEELFSVCNRDANLGNDVLNSIHATASQRAEAFLLVL